MVADSISGSLRPNELQELSEFLTRGFGLPADAECMSANILSWKYLDTISFAQGPRNFIARYEGRIIGHIGFCPRSFTVRSADSREVATIHPIDWFAARGHPYLGYTLLMRGCKSTATRYSIGGTAAAQKVMRILGLEERCQIKIYRKILRPIRRRYALSGENWAWKGLAAARDVVRGYEHTTHRPQRQLEARRVHDFGNEVEEILARWTAPLVYSTRRSELLNYYLRYPGGRFSGWTIHEGQDMVGFALLNTVRVDGPNQVRIAECFLVRPEETLWHAALFALVDVLRQQDPDEVTCFASTPWMAQALEKNGFVQTGSTAMFLQDQSNLLPRDCPYHLTQLEADLAYI